MCIGCPHVPLGHNTRGRQALLSIDVGPIVFSPPCSRTHRSPNLQVEAQNHRFSYNEPIRVEALTQAICDLALNFAEVRISLLLILGRHAG